MKNVRIVARVLRETEKALLLAVQMREQDPIGPGGIDFEREAWIPKSLLTVLDTAYPVETDSDGVGIEAEIPAWLARQKSLLRDAPFRHARQQVPVTLWHGRYHAG